MSFRYTCSLHRCPDLRTECTRSDLGLNFTTNDPLEAEQHSRENNAPMWISREDPDKTFSGTGYRHMDVTKEGLHYD